MAEDQPPTGGARWWRDAWLPLAGLLLAAVLLAAADREADRQQRLRLDAFRDQVRDIARISGSIIEGRLRSLDETLLVLRAAYAADPRGFDASVRLLRNGPLADHELLVVVLDRDGRLAFTDAPGATPGQYSGDRRYFRFFADGGEDALYVDEPSLGRITRRFTLPVVRPLHDERGGFRGVVAISLPQRTLVDFIPDLELSGKTSISVVHHGGAVVNQPPAPAGTPGAALPPELLAQLLQDTEGVFSSGGAPDRPERIVAYRHVHLKNTPFVVSVEASPEDVLHEASFQRGILLGGAGATAIVVLALILFYRKGRRLTARLIEALRSGRQREYETLTRTTLDGFCVSDGAGRVLDVNDAFCAMLGYPRAELLGLSVSDLETDHSSGHLTARTPALVETGYDRALSSLRRRDGRVIVVERSVQHVGEEGGRFFAFFRDITERIRASEEKVRLEDQLRQSQKVEAIGRLAGGVAHDFNTLTAIVLGYGEMLLDELPPGDPRRRHAEQIVEAGRRSSALTRQLLAFSRKQTLQPEVLDLNALLRNFEDMLGRLLGAGIELTFQLAEDPGRIRADPGQIEQVVTNLAVNARDAMPLGGRLTIATASAEFDERHPSGREDVPPGRYVLLSMTDTGCGMDKETLGRLFEPFFTTKAMGKGTGLGLATVYGIARQSGGHVWATSDLEVGTTFTICLPRTDELPEAKAVEAGGEAPRGRGERILLVEDNTALRELCETLLSRLGYAVVAARNGPEALQMVWERRFEPDLVFTDVIMPGMSGAEMVRLLGKSRPGLKVLYMSGYPDDAIAPHGILDPGTAFLPKPFSERDLAVKVGEALRGRAARPGRRVLMIDDDAQFRDLVRHFCTKQGHDFAGAGSAEEALAALAERGFDVLLVDLNIPGTSGEGVLRRIRAAGHAAPAIVLTGDLAAADMASLRPLGAVQALEKSSRSGPLLRAIEEAAPPPGSPERAGGREI